MYHNKRTREEGENGSKGSRHTCSTYAICGGDVGLGGEPLIRKNDSVSDLSLMLDSSSLNSPRGNDTRFNKADAFSVSDQRQTGNEEDVLSKGSISLPPEKRTKIEERMSKASDMLNWQNLENWKIPQLPPLGGGFSSIEEQDEYLLQSQSGATEDGVSWSDAQGRYFKLYRKDPGYGDAFSLDEKVRAATSVGFSKKIDLGFEEKVFGEKQVVLDTVKKVDSASSDAMIGGGVKNTSNAGVISGENGALDVKWNVVFEEKKTPEKKGEEEVLVGRLVLDIVKKVDKTSSDAMVVGIEGEKTSNTDGFLGEKKGLSVKGYIDSEEKKSEDDAMVLDTDSGFSVSSDKKTSSRVVFDEEKTPEKKNEEIARRFSEKVSAVVLKTGMSEDQAREFVKEVSCVLNGVLNENNVNTKVKVIGEEDSQKTPKSQQSRSESPFDSGFALVDNESEENRDVVVIETNLGSSNSDNLLTTEFLGDVA